MVGGLNLGGSIDPLHNAIDVVELAVEKGASVVLMPVSARKQLFDLSDDMATKVTACSTATSARHSSRRLRIEAEALGDFAVG